MESVRLGIITGLAREADCIPWQDADPRLMVVCAAADPSRAAAAAAELAGPGRCRSLISFGIAGGLAPGLVSGALLVPEAVVTRQGERLAVDWDWRQRLIGGLRWPSPLAGQPLIGVDHPVESAADKRSLWRETGADAVDTESHAVARAAVAAGVPFLVVRAVADPSHRTLPSWLARTIASDGRPDSARVLTGLARRPWHLPRMAVLGLDFRRALATLRRVALRAGPLFFFSR